MSNLWDFFSHEAGQDRRRWLDGKLRGAGKALSYYIPPDARPHASAALELGGMFNPVNDIGDAMSAGRDGRWGDMVLSTGVAAAPAVAGKVAKAYNPRMADDVAEWLEEALMGLSVNPTRASLDQLAGDFVADETGAMKIYRGTPYGKADADFLKPKMHDEADLDGVAFTTDRGVADGYATNRYHRHNIDSPPDPYVFETSIDDSNIPNIDSFYADVEGYLGLEPGDVSNEMLLKYARDNDIKAIDSSVIGEPGEIFVLDPSILDKANTLTPAQTEAQNVLDLLSAGRADEVTDDMLAKADDLYLFENYDLPMDEASRMARAEEMGFDTGTDLYHGTDANINAFDPRHFGQNDQGWYGRGVTTDTDPEVAEGYANYNEPEQGQNILPLFSRGRFLDWPDDVQPYATTRDAIQGTKEVKALGYDGTRYANDRDLYGGREEWGTEQVTFDPRNIRSRFARFDPRLKHLSNLSAAAAGIGLLAPAFYSEQGQ